MKRIVFLLIFVLPAISVFSQDYPIFTLGVNSGFDHNINAYKFQKSTLTNPNYQCYGIPDQYNIGMDLSVAVNNRIRPRLELRYVNTSYGIRYDQTSGTDLLKTIWNINNFDFDLHLDYRLITFKKLDVYASPGFKFEYYTGDFLRTTTSNQPSLTSQLNFLESDFPSDIAGGTMSMLFKYNITKNIGITVIPEYTLFFRDYAVSNNKLYQRTTINAGFEFKL